MRSPGVAPRVSRTFFGMVTWPLLEILLVNGILFTLYFKGTLFYAQNQARLGPLSRRKPLPHERREFPDRAEAHALVEVDGLAVGGGHRQAHFPAPVLPHVHERAA